jgi:hypothetical protein
MDFPLEGERPVLLLFEGARRDRGGEGAGIVFTTVLVAVSITETLAETSFTT